MNAIDYPEILEALESGTVNATTIGGVVEWIQAQTGKAIHDCYLAFRDEILSFVEVKKNEALQGIESYSTQSNNMADRTITRYRESSAG